MFFFKQKTAYEMRISDWSSDVCSSDLKASDSDRNDPWLTEVNFAGPLPQNVDATLALPEGVTDQSGRTLQNQANFPLKFHIDRAQQLVKFAAHFGILEARSEEHTSEHLSLLSITKSAYYLKKKNT